MRGKIKKETGEEYKVEFKQAKHVESDSIISSGMYPKLKIFVGVQLNEDQYASKYASISGLVLLCMTYFLLFYFSSQHSLLSVF